MTALMMALGIVGFRELTRLAEAAGVKLLTISGLAAVLALASSPYWYSRVAVWLAIDGSGFAMGFPEIVFVLLCLMLLLMFGEQLLRYRTEDALRRIGATTFAALYLGACLALVLWLRIRFGMELLVVFLAAVKFTDIGAYFTGSVIGRHKMIPWLSPGKSWGGLVGGLVAAVGVSMLAVRLVGLQKHLNLWESAIFGIAVALAGQFGDLCESLLKRSAQQKDSGSLVPEFGGVLDIIDSPLMAAPIALVVLWIVG